MRRAMCWHLKEVGGDETVRGGWSEGGKWHIVN